MNESLANQFITCTYDKLLTTSFDASTGCFSVAGTSNLPIYLSGGIVRYNGYIDAVSPGVGITITSYITGVGINNIPGPGVGVTICSSGNNTAGTASTCPLMYVGSHLNQLCNIPPYTLSVGSRAITATSTCGYNAFNSHNTRLSTSNATHIVGTHDSYIATRCFSPIVVNATNICAVSSAGTQTTNCTNCHGMLLGGTNNVFSVNGASTCINTVLQGCSNVLQYGGSVCDYQSYIHNGICNQNYGQNAIITGSRNFICSQGVVVYTGAYNSVSSTSTCFSTIFSGISNTSNISNTSTAWLIGTGMYNTISAGGTNDIITGNNNMIYRATGVIGTGEYNAICSSSLTCYGLVLNGVCNISYAQPSCAVILNGQCNIGSKNFVFTGYRNCAAGYTGTGMIESGESNVNLNGISNIFAGCGNYIGASCNIASNSIFSGLSNSIRGTGSPACYTDVYSGECNTVEVWGTATACKWQIVGGYSNSIKAISGALNEYGRTIIGGCCNSINSYANLSCSTIFGGRNNILQTDRRMILGSNILTPVNSSTAGIIHMNNLVITNIPTASAGLASGSWWVCGADTRLRIIP